VPRVTLLLGVVLIVLGIIGFIPHQAPTALIPAAFGLVFAILGVLAGQEAFRKHAMHAAAALGLIGFLGAAVMVIRALAAGVIERPLAFTLQIAMAVLCVGFVALCVKSFIDARRRRSQRGET
jgi:uncharacterized membrane protein HdeD (DUF308 family)